MSRILPIEGLQLSIPAAALEPICHRWKIARLEIFGSALRSDFRETSDADLLVTFESGTNWSLIDHLKMEEEFEAILGRPVDLVTRRAVEHSRNPIRRSAILSTARTFYAA